jgi:predicted DCC family thiol-disulfide oxidoreductase YuxK
MTNKTQDQPAIWPLTLYYDGACPLCSAEMQNLMLRNQQGLLEFVDISAQGFEAPPGVTQDALMTAMHGHWAQGEWLRGVPVFEAAYSAVGLPQVSRVLHHPLVRPMAEVLYPVVARLRHRIPAWVAQRLFGTALRRAAQVAAKARCDGMQCTAPSASSSTPLKEIA